MNPKHQGASSSVTLSPPASAKKRSSSTASKIRPPTTRQPTTFTAPQQQQQAQIQQQQQPQNRKNSRSASVSAPTISRSIQACNRCRARKTRCDQQFPSCSACLKAGVECIGIDAATGREIPRSYVDWLEKRVKHLEEQLRLEQQGSPPAGGAHSPVGQTNDRSPSENTTQNPVRKESDSRQDTDRRQDADTNGDRKPLYLRPDIENLVNDVGLVGVQATSSPGFMGGSSGISFARLMFAAVKTSRDSQSLNNSNPSSAYAGCSKNLVAPDPSASATVIPRKFQLATPCSFPNRDFAEQLMEIYFQQANPQFPILHRPTFQAVFRRVCDRMEQQQQYKGSDSDLDRIQNSADLYFAFICFAIASAMSSSTENMPERFHASAMQHMDSLFMSVSVSNNRLDGLKGVLLLALYSMMRPAAPGVWYVLGAALRLAVDMGLHQENTARAEKQWDPVALDERRRLFWCTYSLDRQVCVYLGRPFGIADDAIKTPFPIDVSDEYITPSGIQPEGFGRKSSRTISLHMFRIRELQSEIQQVLYQTCELTRRFKSIENWRQDMEVRLQNWCDTAPKNQSETGCGYNLSFVDLNYQQTRLLLYGLSPAAPTPTTEAFEIIADSGSKIIKAYRHLHREKKINYAWLACHNLFMAGTSYLCALWQSAEVRASTTIEQIDFNTLACIGVLSSMVERCPAAQTCRDVFEYLAASTLQRCNNEYTATRPSSASTCSEYRPVKRVKTEMPHHDWTPTSATTATTADGSYTSSAVPQTPSQIPASLANLLHHAPPPPTGPTSLPTPPQQHPAETYRQPYEMHPYTPYLEQSQQQPHNFHHQQHEIDQVFRTAQDLSPYLTQGGAEMTAGMDGSRLFEMIQEVGSSGGTGWDTPVPMGVLPATGTGWGYDGSWSA